MSRMLPVAWCNRTQAFLIRSVYECADVDRA